MARIKFHTIAAIVVLAASAAWVLTGEFSSVGSQASAASDDNNKPAESAGSTDSSPALKTVAIVEPPFIEHRRAIRISGQTEPDKRSKLATRAAGIVTKLPVSEGTRVNKDDLIITLDNGGKATAVESAQATLEQREKEFEAAERLAKRGSLPKLQLDNKRSALALARSQLEQARAELDRYELRAPFAGIIDSVDVELGASASQGAPVATLLSLDPILATGEVSERDLANIALGGTATVRLISGDLVEGSIRYISRQANASTRTYPVEIAIPNPELEIPAGMTAEIILRSDPVTAVKLPRSVVTLSENGDLGIKIVKPDQTVGFIEIDLVDDMPDGLVLGGIPQDSLIIVAGQELVANGEKVNAVAANMEMLRRLAGNSQDK